MIGKKINQLATELAPVSTDLTIIGDPISGVSKKITLAQLGAIFSGAVSFYTNLAGFPAVGDINVIYCAKDTQKLYLWSGSAYTEVFPSQALLDTYQLRSEKGVSNGYASLDSGGKVPISQLPSSIMEYKGTWNAATNTPTLANGTGDTGDVYICNVAGTVNFGAGPITFAVGDYVIYSGTIWQRSSGAVGTVTSVALTVGGDAISVSGSPLTTSGTLALAFSGTSAQYINGAGNLITFPTSLISGSGASGQVTFFNGANSVTGTNNFFWDATNNRLGIGTTTPQRSIEIYNTTADNHLRLSGNAPSVSMGEAVTGSIYQAKFGLVTTNGQFVSAGVAGDFVIISQTGATIIGTSSTEKMRVNTSGNVSINNTNNTYKLDVTGTGRFTGQLRLESTITDGTNTYTLPSATGTLALTSQIPSVTGYVPYTGATANLDLGTHTLIAAKGTFSSSGSGDTVGITHSSGSGIALNITKGGSGEGLYINKTSGSGNAATIIGTLNATTLVKSGGTSAQFLKADGSVDSTSYGTGSVTSVGLSSATSGVTIGSTPITTSGTITLAIATASGSQQGLLSSTDWTTFNNKQNALTNPVTGTGTTNYLPKFTGASTIGNSLVYDNGTNVGIGTSTPSAKLFIVTGGVGSVSNGIGMDNGAQQHFWYLSDNTTSTYQINSGSGVFRWVNSNGELMRLNASGNLSIGNTNDTYKLDVSGTSRFTESFELNTTGTGALGFFGANNTTDKYFRIRNSSGNFEMGTSSTEHYLIGNGAIPLKFFTSGTTRLTIASTGAATFSSSVTAGGKIFTSASVNDNIIEVINSDTTNGYGLYVRGGGTSAGRYVARFKNGADNDVMWIGPSNVGIGTTSPSNFSGYTTLSISGTNGGVLDLMYNGTSQMRLSAENGNNYLSGVTNAPLLFATNSTERMRITSGGNVGIGETPTSSIGWARILTLNGNNVGDTAYILKKTGSAQEIAMGTDGAGCYHDIAGAASASNNNHIFRTGGTNSSYSVTERMRITSGGEVYIAGTTDQGAYNLQVNGTGVWGAGAYVNGSDFRLKENISDLDNSLELINKMKPVTYNYKGSYSKDSSTQTGFIAQDLKELLKDKKYLDGIVKQGPEYMSVAYQNLIPLLVKGIQELKQELDTLKNK
jgi:hypothetical protein